MSVDKERTGTPATTPPTLIQKKKESRRHHLFDGEDDKLPLQCRTQRLARADAEDDAPALHINPNLNPATTAALTNAGMASVFATEPLSLTTSDATAHYHAVQILHPPDSEESDDSELTPEELVEAIIESTCMHTLDDWGAGAIVWSTIPSSRSSTLVTTTPSSASLMAPMASSRAVMSTLRIAG